MIEMLPDLMAVTYRGKLPETIAKEKLHDLQYGAPHRQLPRQLTAKAACEALAFQPVKVTKRETAKFVGWVALEFPRHTATLRLECCFYTVPGNDGTTSPRSTPNQYHETEVDKTEIDLGKFIGIKVPDIRTVEILGTRGSLKVHPGSDPSGTTMMMGLDVFTKYFR